MLGHRSVDGPEIGGVLVPGELEPDLEDQLVDLGVEFHPKKWHQLSITLNKIQLR